MGLSIDQVDYEHYLKMSIPLHLDKESLIFHLRQLADELEKKFELTNQYAWSISTSSNSISPMSLEVTLQKNIPFDRLDYMSCKTIEELFQRK
jgi:hypothetical protein